MPFVLVRLASAFAGLCHGRLHPQYPMEGLAVRFSGCTLPFTASFVGDLGCAFRREMDREL